MATEAQTCALVPQVIGILTILVALHLSRVLYKSTLFMQNKPNLLNAQMNVTFFITSDYLKKCLRQPPKTNPKQSQNKPNTNPIPEMPKMNESLFATKVYENITTFKPQKNKPNTNPIKPNQTQFQTQRLLIHRAKPKLLNSPQK